MRLLRSVGISMTIIFGGGFLVRLIRNSEFYIAEFIVGILGIILICISLMFARKSDSNPS